MRTSKFVLLFLMVTALVTSFTYSEALAVADGDGFCSAGELASADCAIFGSNVLEFRGALTGSCPTTDGGDPNPASCTGYFYNYNGASQNQVVLAVPDKLTQIINNTAETHCGNYLDPGEGDPTTGWGENQLNIRVCRISQSLATLPGDITPPTNPPADFVIFTDPSFPDSSMPSAWQIRFSKNSVFAGLVNGPTTLTEPIFQTGVTFTSATGETCEVSNNGIVDCPGGREVTLGQAIFCVEIEECTIPGACDFPTEYECDVLTHTGENIVLRAGFNTNCWIGPYGGRYYWGNYC